MKEDFLHFIWQYQYFDKSDLTTASGDRLSILRQGFSNVHSGPDFSECRIKINNLEWAGNIEIHYKSSDWYAHRHNLDKAYDNVILHVVWADDKPVSRTDTSVIPTLELKHRIKPELIKKYNNFIKYEDSIICTPFFKSVPSIEKANMLGKVLVKRLEDKSNKISEMLTLNGNNWEQTTYQVLAANFGFKLNEYSFSRLSRLLPFQVISRHTNNQQQLEALLFGTAGMLEQEFKEDYPNFLKKEYRFLAHKYALKDHQLMNSDWKYSKIRPANFPTIRIAQFAYFLKNNFPVFASFLKIDSVMTLFSPQRETKSYWSDHYMFDKITDPHPFHIGKSSVLNIMINTVIPLLLCYAKEKDDGGLYEKAIALLETIAAEKNNITEKWRLLGLKCNNAFESQGAIELYNNYCTKKACLHCSIGVSILQAKNL